MLRVLGQQLPKVPFAVDQQVAGALAPQRSHIPLAKEFALGERTGVPMIHIPLQANTSSNTGVNLLSGSRIRNLLRHEVARCE